MPNPVATLVNAAVEETANVLGGHVTAPGSWFDGFWDYFVENRDRLLRGPAWQISGMTGRNWAIELLAPDELDLPLFEAHLFVEAKDYRAKAVAPWPVSTVVLGDAAPPELGAPDRFDRPHNSPLAENLRRRGFVTRFGYWGVHCEAYARREEGRAADRVHSILLALPDALAMALALADSP